MQLVANENLAGLVARDVFEKNWVSAEPEAVFAYYERTRALPSRGLRAEYVGQEEDSCTDENWADVIDLRDRQEDGEGLSREDLKLLADYEGRTEPSLIEDGRCLRIYEAYTAVRDGHGRQAVLTAFDIVGRGDDFRANMEQLAERLDAAGIMFEKTPIPGDFVVLSVGCSLHSVGPEMKNSAGAVLRTVTEAEDELMAVLRTAHTDGLLRGVAINTMGPQF